MTNCVICGKAITPRFALCAACLEIYGDRKDWPDWLKFLAADSQRQRRAAAKEPIVVENLDLDDGGAGALEALSSIRLVELFCEAKLTRNQLCAVALKIYAGLTESMMAATGGWKSQQAAHDAWATALTKMRAVLQPQEDFMDKFDVRTQITLTWCGVPAADRQAVQRLVTETMTKFFTGDAGPSGWEDGISLDKETLTIAVTDIQGPSHRRRVPQARDGFPEGATVGSAAPLTLGVPR